MHLGAGGAGTSRAGGSARGPSSGSRALPLRGPGPGAPLASALALAAPRPSVPLRKLAPARRAARTQRGGEGAGPLRGRLRKPGGRRGGAAQGAGRGEGCPRRAGGGVSVAKPECLTRGQCRRSGAVWWAGRGRSLARRGRGVGGASAPAGGASVSASRPSRPPSLAGPSLTCQRYLSRISSDSDFHLL